MKAVIIDSYNNEFVKCFNEYEWEESIKNVKLCCAKEDFNIMSTTAANFKRVELYLGRYTLVLEFRDGKIYGPDTRNAVAVSLGRLIGSHALIPYDDQEFIKEKGGPYRFIYELIKQFDLED